MARTVAIFLFFLLLWMEFAGIRLRLDFIFHQTGAAINKMITWTQPFLLPDHLLKNEKTVRD
jgi:hypothetical protein